MRYFGFGHKELEKLEYNSYGRPFFKGHEIDFNISHSGNYAICAVSNTSRVGIDIEQIKPLSFRGCRKNFTCEEWNSIQSASNPLLKFYSFWSRKESVIKADGRGISIPLKNIEVINDFFEYDSQAWYLKNIPINEDYSTCITSSIADICMKFFKVDFFGEV